jgi:hypothetical protein
MKRISTPFTALFRNFYFFPIFMGIVITVFQVFPGKTMPMGIYLFLVLVLCAFVIYLFKRSKILFDAEADGKKIIIENGKQKITVNIDEIESIQTMLRRFPSVFYRVKIKLREEKDGIKEFECGLENSGDDEKYFLDPFRKKGGKIEKVYFAFH